MPPPTFPPRRGAAGLYVGLDSRHDTADVADPSSLLTPPHTPSQSVGKVMQAAGKRWRDATLDEWPENDHRIFVGDLGRCGKCGLSVEGVGNVGGDAGRVAQERAPRLQGT